MSHRAEDGAGVAMVDLTDRTALVTGSTDGIGRETALALGRLGATVVVHGRDRRKGARVVEAIDGTGGEAGFLRADFSDFGAVRSLADDVVDRVGTLDLLVNNAGAYFRSGALTDAGVERTFAVNHLAPFLLTNRLRPFLADTGRVVTVSSAVHRRTDLDLQSLRTIEGYDGLAAYSRSKLANILFTRELARRLDGPTANCLHPGLVPGSALWRKSPRYVQLGVRLIDRLPRVFSRWFAETPASGAETSVYLAASPAVADASGRYYADCEPKTPSATSGSGAWRPPVSTERPPPRGRRDRPDTDARDRRRVEPAGDSPRRGWSPSNTRTPIREPVHRAVMELSGRRILVTGGAGFVGSHLAEDLLPDNDVTVVDDLSSGRHDWVPDAAELVEGDLSDPAVVSTAITADLDLVVHGAAEKQVDTAAPRRQFEDNVGMTYTVLERLHEVGVRHLLFTSSSTVYGEAPRPTPEDYGPLEPISAYGAAKLAEEGLCSTYAHSHGFTVWNVRFANIVGPRLQRGAVIPDFIAKLRADPETLEILGDGRQEKSYMHIEDCVAAMRYVVEHAAGAMNTVNLGTRTNTAVRRIADIVADEMGLDPRYDFTGGERGWTGDVPRMRLAIGKLRDLGWEPALESDEAVRRATRELLAG